MFGIRSCGLYLIRDNSIVISGLTTRVKYFIVESWIGCKSYSFRGLTYVKPRLKSSLKLGIVRNSYLVIIRF